MAPCDHSEVVVVAGDKGRPKHNNKAYNVVGFGKPIHYPGGSVPLLVLEQAACTQWYYETSKSQGNHVIRNLKVGKQNHFEILGVFLKYALGLWLTFMCLSPENCIPRSHTQSEVIPKLEMELINVIVIERLTSPSNIEVQKLDAFPPGADPARISPSFSKSFVRKRAPMPQAASGMKIN